MNPELLLSFALMQGLAPAGTTVPVEAVLTSADAMPAWARFTFQVYLLQKLQEELAATKAQLADLRTHHAQSHTECAALKTEIKTLIGALRERFEGKARFEATLQELRARPDLARLVEIADADRGIAVAA